MNTLPSCIVAPGTRHAPFNSRLQLGRHKWPEANYMTEQEATNMATQLLSTYRSRAFEISMPDQASYEQMRATFARLGRSTGPDGEFFVIKVFAAPEA
jgi:hypothetical protein